MVLHTTSYIYLLLNEDSLSLQFVDSMSYFASFPSDDDSSLDYSPPDVRRADIEEEAAMDEGECKERVKMHPTTEELRLLGEVSSLIDGREHGECGLLVCHPLMTIMLDIYSLIVCFVVSADVSFVDAT